MNRRGFFGRVLAGLAALLPAGWLGRRVHKWCGRTLKVDDRCLMMSAFGDPTDWNYCPFPMRVEQAVAIGFEGQIVGLKSLSDEVLRIDASTAGVFHLIGDPMRGGRLELQPLDRSRSGGVG